MPHRIFVHLRANVVGYVALFIALGGSSYAAVRLAPGSVHASAIAKGAVTHSKLATNSVRSGNIANGTLGSADFKSGTFLQGLKGDAGASGSSGLKGLDGLKGPTGNAGPTGAAGRDGSASIGMQARMSGSVSAPHGASTSVPVTGGTWTQSAGELDFIAGSATIHVPSSCTGSFGNALVVSVDGTAQTFAVAPTVPASTTVTVPLVVGTLSEPDSDTPHTLTASFGNSCTKSGEDYSVTGVKIDAVKIG
jgi:hypothetical protein